MMRSKGTSKMTGLLKKFSLLATVIISLALVTSCAHMGNTTSQKSASPVLDRIMKNGELVVGTAGSMPPLNMTTKKGEVIGLEIDIANMMAKSMDVKLRIETMPFSELLPALEAGKIDMIMSCMTITPKRNLKVAFVGPYFLSGKALLTKAETLAAVKEPDELSKNEITLAALEGSTSQIFVEKMIPEARLTLTKHYDEAVNMVIQGQVDAMIADHPICITSVIRHKDKKLFTLINPLTYEPIGIALPADDALFINWTANFLTTFKDSGLLKILEMKWFKGDAWLDELP